MNAVQAASLAKYPSQRLGMAARHSSRVRCDIHRSEVFAHLNAAIPIQECRRTIRAIHLCQICPLRRARRSVCGKYIDRCSRQLSYMTGSTPLPINCC